MEPSPAQRPLPVIDDETRPYWAATAQHQLVIQLCGTCGRHVFYPRALCPHCHSDDLTWSQVSGQGLIHSFTIARRAPHPAFESLVPYVVALVDLDEGPRMLTNILVDDVDSVFIGQAVDVEFVEITPEVTLPMFRPAEGAAL